MPEIKIDIKPDDVAAVAKIVTSVAHKRCLHITTAFNGTTLTIVSPYKSHLILIQKEISQIPTKK